MKLDTKTYLVGKKINTLGSSEIPENSLDITDNETQIYHIIPSCAYILSNGTATPQDISFFLFKKENNIIQDITSKTKFVIQYTVNGVPGTFNLDSNRLSESGKFPYHFSDIDSLMVEAYDNNIKAATFNIACIEEKSGGGSGSTGQKGEDGLTIFVLPSIVTFKSDENGIVSDQAAQNERVQIIAYRGSVVQDVQITKIISTEHAEAELIENNKDYFRFKAIEQHEVTMSTSDENGPVQKKINISYTSGSATVQVSINKVSTQITVPFIVDNTELYDSYYVRTTKEMTSIYHKYQVTGQEIKDDYTKIQQTADKIFAEAKQVSDSGKALEEKQSQFEITYDQQLQEVSKKYTELDTGYQSLKDSFSKIDADSITLQVSEAVKDANYAKDSVSSLRTTANNIDSRVKTVETTIGTNGEKIISEAESKITQNADKIVADVLTKENGQTKEGILKLTDDSFKIGILKDGLQTAGITIDYDNPKDPEKTKINISADNINFEGTDAINLISNEVSASGNLSAKSLTTNPDGNDPAIISIEGSYLKAYNKKSQHNTSDPKQDKPNLVLGTNEGKLQFEYYDNSGNLLWSLGENGFIQYVGSGDMSSSMIVERLNLYRGIINSEGEIEEYDLSRDQYGKEKEYFLFIDRTGQYNNQIIDSSNQITCYQYRAPKSNGKIVNDKDHNLSADQAAQLNYLWIYSSDQTEFPNNNKDSWDLTNCDLWLSLEGEKSKKIKVLGNDVSNTDGHVGFVNEVFVKSSEKWDYVNSFIQNDYLLNIGTPNIYMVSTQTDTPESGYKQLSYFMPSHPIVYAKNQPSQYVKS